MGHYKYNVYMKNTYIHYVRFKSGLAYLSFQTFSILHDKMFLLFPCIFEIYAFLIYSYFTIQPYTTTSFFCLRVIQYPLTILFPPPPQSLVTIIQLPTCQRLSFLDFKYEGDQGTFICLCPGLFYLVYVLQFCPHCQTDRI